VNFVDLEKLGLVQGRSPSWAGVGHGPPEKIENLTTLGLLCEILYNFSMIFVFGISKSALIGLLAI